MLVITQPSVTAVKESMGRKCNERTVIGGLRCKCHTIVNDDVSQLYTIVSCGCNNGRLSMKRATQKLSY